MWLWYFWEEAVLARLSSLLKTFQEKNVPEQRINHEFVIIFMFSSLGLFVSHLQHELHADPVFYQPHHQVGFTLEHLVVLPGQSVGVFTGEVEVGGWTTEK